MEFMETLFRRRYQPRRVADAPPMPERAVRRVAGPVCGLAALALVTGLVATVSGGPAAGAGADKLLQVVQLGLGADGTITTVKRSDIAQDKDGYHASEADLDPSAVADELPVAVSTVYTAPDGSAGTDLSELKGVDGDVRIGFTVDNLTVAPQEIAIPGDAHVTALVGAPYTIVATAVLPKDSVSSIATAKSAANDGLVGDTGTVTTLPNGDYQVQWATVLAPPALPQSATFVLAEQAHGFELESLSITATPGTTTDPGLAQLIQTTFGDNNPMQQLENNTVVQIQQAVNKLLEVQGDIADLGASLTELATGTGAGISAQVAAEQKALATELASLSNQLVRLSNGLAISLNGNAEDTADAIRAGVDAVAARLGFSASGTALGDPKTVLGKIQALRSVLVATGTETGSDLEAVRAAVKTAMTGLAPAITQLATDMSTLAGSLFAGIQAGLSEEAAALNQMRVSLAYVGSLIGAARCDTDGISASSLTGSDLTCDGPDASADAIYDSLAAVLDGSDTSLGLAALIDALLSEAGLGGVDSKLSDARSKQATASAKADSASEAAASAAAAASRVAEKASAVGDAICAATPTPTPNGTGIEESFAAYASAIAAAAGVDCKADRSGLSDDQTAGLKKLADDNVDAVSAFSDAVSDTQSAIAAIGTALDTSADGASGLLDSTIDLIGDATGTESPAPGTLLGDLDLLNQARDDQSALKEAVSTLVADLGKFGDSTALSGLGSSTVSDCASASPATATPSAPTTTDPAPLGTLASLFEYACSVHASVAAMPSQAASSLEASMSASASSLASGLATAQAAADAELSAAASKVPAAVGSAAANLESQASAALSAAASEAHATGAAAAAGIRADATSAGKEFISGVAGFNKTQAASSKELQKNLQVVINQLDSPDGTGLLHNMVDTANKVGTQSDDVGATSLSQSSYGSVRSAELLSSRIRTAQIVEGMNKAREFKPIGETLSTADPVCTVALVFTIGTIK
ncbi:MAG: hypothetical protein QM655_14900 [Nocardioidaceae bacterium]